MFHIVLSYLFSYLKNKTGMPFGNPATQHLFLLAKISAGPEALRPRVTAPRTSIGPVCGVHRHLGGGLPFSEALFESSKSCQELLTTLIHYQVYTIGAGGVK